MTTDRPITVQTIGGHLCIPATPICLGNEWLPIITVLPVIVAAFIAGWFALKSAATTASAALEAQRLSLEATETRERENRERSSKARRRRLAPLLRNLAHQFNFLGTTPAAEGEKQTMTWRIAQLEKCAADDRLIEMLSDTESDALFDSVDVCKFAYQMLLDFDMRFVKADNDTARTFYRKRSREFAMIALRQIRLLVDALNDPVATTRVDELIKDLKDYGDQIENRGA